MFTRERRVASFALSLALAGTAITSHSSSQARGGKPAPPPPNITRPITFCQPIKIKGQYYPGLVRSDVNGTSPIILSTTVPSAQNRGGWPRWSPDGQLIGGYRKFGPDGSASLMVITPDRATESVVMTEAEFDAWNLSRPGVLDSAYLTGNAGVPGAQRIDCWFGTDAFIVNGWTDYVAGGTYGLFIIDRAGAITPLYESAYNIWNPHWSEAIDKVLFFKNDGQPNLCVINSDGTGLQRIMFFGTNLNPVNPVHAVWSPSGDQIAVVVIESGSKGGTAQLYILDVDLTLPNPVITSRRLTAADSSDERFPAWSPDGWKLVFKHSDYPSAPADSIVIVDLQTGMRSLVATGGCDRPDWDPLDLP